MCTPQILICLYITIQWNSVEVERRSDISVHLSTQHRGRERKKSNKDCMKERKMCETGPVWAKTLLGRCWGSSREGEIQSEEKKAKARRKWNTRWIAVAAEETEGSKAWKRQRISDEEKKARKRPKPTGRILTNRKYFPGEDCSSSVWYCFTRETNL